jgi:hypothetical protein
VESFIQYLLFVFVSHRKKRSILTRIIFVQYGDMYSVGERKELMMPRLLGRFDADEHVDFQEEFLKPVWILLQQVEKQTVLNLVETDTALGYSDLALACVFRRIRARVGTPSCCRYSLEG